MPPAHAASMISRASSSVFPLPKNAGADPMPPKLPQPSERRVTRASGIPTGSRRRRLNWSTAQVRLSQIVVDEEVGSLAGEDDPAGGEDVPAVGDRQRHVRVLLDEQHRAAPVVPLLDDLHAL